MLIALLSFLIIVPITLICCYPMKNRFRQPVQKFITQSGILILVMIPAAAFLHIYTGIDKNLILYFSLCIMFYFYRRIIDVHISKSLAVFLWCLALMSILANFAAGFDALQNPDLGLETNTIEYAVFQLAAGIAAALILYYPVTKYGSILIDQLNLNIVWYLTMPFSLIILLANTLLRPHYYQTLYTNNVFMAYWSILSATLLIWILLSTIFYFIVTGILNTAKIRERNRFLEMQEAQFRAQQKYLEESARVRHDFRQVIRTLQELAQEENPEALKEYIDKFAEALPENEYIRFCGNIPLNALLNYYAQSAATQQIRLDLKIDLPDQLPVSDIDLCGMIGNILENGVTACLKIPEQERWIQLTVLTKNNAQLFIVAANSFNGKVKQKDGQYLSSSHRSTGLGLSSIRTTAEHYNGTADFSHRSREFYIDIVIPLI